MSNPSHCHSCEHYQPGQQKPVWKHNCCRLLKMWWFMSINQSGLPCCYDTRRKEATMKRMIYTPPSADED